MTEPVVELRRVELHDEPALRAWWEVWHAVELERPVDLTVPWEVDRWSWTTPRVGTDQVLLSALIGAETVGAAHVGLPSDHNPHLARIDVAVARPHRRRGVGTALAAKSEVIARRADRTTAVAGARMPIDDDRSPGLAFAQAHGYSLASQDVIKVADLAATADRWPELAAQAAERTDPYGLLAVSSPCPDDLVDDVCAMFSRFLGEIPLGDLDLRPQRWTGERLRAVEAARDRRQVDYLMVAAQDADGALVGYTDVDVPIRAPRVGSIHSTLVLPAARGHRLGLAMKVRLHRLVRERFPDTELIVTGNAAVNTHMNSVNEALGYRPVDRSLDLQKRLAAVAP